MSNPPTEAEIRALVRSALERLLADPSSTDAPTQAVGRRPVIDERAVGAMARGASLDVPPGALVTPLARDLALERKVLLERSSPKPSVPSVGGPADKTIAIGADHGGYGLKEQLKAYLTELGWQPLDCGAHNGKDAVDYPDYAYAVAALVAEGRARWGIVVDGAGIGSCMAANKVPGIRAALCYDQASAANSREHNHANVLTLGAGLIGPALAKQIVKTWLETPFAPGRHARRVEKIMAIERRYLKR